MRKIDLVGCCAIFAAILSVLVVVAEYHRSDFQVLYDDFTGPQYSLAEGMNSPNGLWFSQFNGGGTIGTRLESNSNSTNYIFYEAPAVSKGASEIHSALTVSKMDFRNFDMSIDVRTDKQLRLDAEPNPWETGWIFWRWSDNTHFYYFVQKTDGVEVGKYDGGTNPENQIFLRTSDDSPAKIGTWARWTIIANDSHFIIRVNDHVAFDFVDKSSFSTGKIGLYSEDASVSFDNMRVIPS